MEVERKSKIFGLKVTLHGIKVSLILHVCKSSFEAVYHGFLIAPLNFFSISFLVALLLQLGGIESFQ